VIERFEGESGRQLRAEVLAAQRMVCGNRALAEELADRVRLRAPKAGEALIEQDADDNEVYFILAGTCDVVNGRTIGKRGPGGHLGQSLGWRSLPLAQPGAVGHSDGYRASRS
jgi:CRP/FNR family cyclic AMP-dependent transcriptional regulator